MDNVETLKVSTTPSVQWCSALKTFKDVRRTEFKNDELVFFDIHRYIDSMQRPSEQLTSWSGNQVPFHSDHW